jgi:hypothetical protein
MGKQIIRLTESDLHNIVKESVEKILREAIDELDPRAYASARDKQNAIDADYDKQMADYNKKNPFSRMMSKKPQMPKGYGRGSKFNDAAVDAFNRDYGHDWSNPNSIKHQTMGKSGNVTQYSQLGDSTFTTDYDFDARQAKAGVEPTGRGRGVVTSGGWNNKTHQNFAPTKRGMTYSDADYTLRSGANKSNFFDKGIKVADQMANGTGKYQDGKWH